MGGGERARTSLGMKMKLFGRKDQAMSVEDRRGEREAAELKRLEILKARKKGLLLPDAPELDIWMLWVMGPLIMYSCLVVPVVVAWDLETTLAQDVVEYIFDFTFFIDILINFSSAYKNEDNEVALASAPPSGRPRLPTRGPRVPAPRRSPTRHPQVVLDRKKIAKRYAQSWFFIDLVATMPWELFAGSSGSSLGVGEEAEGRRRRRRRDA